MLQCIYFIHGCVFAVLNVLLVVEGIQVFTFQYLKIRGDISTTDMLIHVYKSYIFQQSRLQNLYNCNIIFVKPVYIHSETAYHKVKGMISILMTVSNQFAETIAWLDQEKTGDE